MHCHEFERRLHELLDERRDPAADGSLCAHAEACEPCRRLLAGQQALFAGLAALPVPQLSGDFSRRVVGRSGTLTGSSSLVERVVSDDRPRALLAVGVLAATAAAVLLAVSLAWYARGGGTDVAGGPQPAVELIAPDTSGQPADAPPPRRMAGGVALTQRSLLIEAPRLPQHVRGGYHGAIDNLSATLPETVEQLQDVERIAPGIRPIRTTFGRLWDALCGADGTTGAATKPTSGAGVRPAALRIASLS